MNIVGQKFENGEYFIPELLLCSDAMYSGISVLRPHIKKDAANAAGRIF
jgi:methanogenic corrinoid protein MtbC1